MWAIIELQARRRVRPVENEDGETGFLGRGLIKAQPYLD